MRSQLGVSEQRLPWGEPKGSLGDTTEGARRRGMEMEKEGAVWGRRELCSSEGPWVGLFPCNPEGKEGTALIAEAEFSVTPKRCKRMAVGTGTPGSQGCLSRA